MASPQECGELNYAQVVNLDAGLKFPLPAVAFSTASQLTKLKAAFTCGFLIDTAVEVVAEGLLSNMRENWPNEEDRSYQQL